MMNLKTMDVGMKNIGIKCVKAKSQTKLHTFFIATWMLLSSALGLPYALADESLAQAQDNKGVVAFEQGNYQVAETYFLQQLKNPANKNESLIYLSRIAIETGKALAAVGYIEEALKLAPTDADELVLSGDVYCNQAQQSSMFAALGLAKKCIAQYEAAVQLAPEHANALLAAIRFYLEAPGIAGGSNKKGEDLLARLQVVSPEDANTYQVFLLDNKGEADAALKLADELSKKGFTSARNQYELAHFYRDKKRYTQAGPLFESLLSQPITPQNKWYINDSLLQLGEILLAENKDISRSIALMEQYKQNNNNPHDKHYLWSSWSLAQAYKLDGNKEKYALLVQQIQAEDYKKNADFAKRFEAGIKAN